MTDIGTVIDGKYEILKEIGRGGMSIVYLAMDIRLNKQWAVKEIRKKGNGKNDEVVVNSLLAEANLMKRLDHPALPRIVDIIDNGVTIYVVMDYIEGESLDKVLNEFGAQPEELVVNWAKQLCDALSYLHSQKPSIIYRDMKPANVMLKPEGNIKIIDFGIAREYKEQNLADTTVLGTKGYAPPEQYSGQTDPRSDIYALGMTMHHLLTGVDPRNGEPYAPVRSWNPELSEGIEIIIDKCVEPAAENRYQNCADLIYDLEHPELITKGYKKKQKRKLFTFIISAVLAVVFAISGIVLNMVSTQINENDYELNLVGSDPEKFYSAIAIYPERTDAYNTLVEYCKQNNVSNTDIGKLSNTVNTNSNYLDVNDSEVAQLYYNVGKLYFSDYDGSIKDQAAVAKEFFERAYNSDASFDKKDIAQCYYNICKFITSQSTTYEPSIAEYEALFDEIERSIDIIDNTSDNEANYDKISFYNTAMGLIRSQIDALAGLNFDKNRVLSLMETIYENTEDIYSQKDYVNKLKEEVTDNYERDVNDINNKYAFFEERQQGGN